MPFATGVPDRRNAQRLLELKLRFARQILRHGVSATLPGRCNSSEQSKVCWVCILLEQVIAAYSCGSGAFLSPWKGNWLTIFLSASFGICDHCACIVQMGLHAFFRTWFCVRVWTISKDVKLVLRGAGGGGGVSGQRRHPLNPWKRTRGDRPGRRRAQLGVPNMFLSCWCLLN